MKQLFILFALIFATDSFASGIDANATDASCDNTTLETYSGTANVEINWIPNTIQTRWYNGNTLIDTTNTDAASCEYDDVLNVPPTPTARTGYTFTGWTVRPEMDFGTIPTNESGLECWAMGWYDDANYCWYNNRNTGNSTAHHVNCDSDSMYNELQPHEWKVKFSYGTLYGMSGCSTTSGTTVQIENIIIDSGNYCWCKATGYRANNASVTSGPTSTLFWLYQHDNGGSATTCAQYCARHCVNAVMYSSGNRTALFTPAN